MGYAVIVAVPMAATVSLAAGVLGVLVPLNVDVDVIVGGGHRDRPLTAAGRRPRGVRPGESRTVQCTHQMDADQQYQPEQQDHPGRAPLHSIAEHHTGHTLTVMI